MKGIRSLVVLAAALVASAAGACGGRSPRGDGGNGGGPGEGRSDGRGGVSRAPGDQRVVPGITVLLDDSIRLIAGKRVALVTRRASWC